MLIIAAIDENIVSSMLDWSSIPLFSIPSSILWTINIALGTRLFLLLLLTQQKSFIIIRLVKFIVLKFNMLKQRSIRTVAFATYLDRTYMISFDLVGRPSVSLLLVLVVFHLLETFRQRILLRIYQFELIRQNVVFSNQSDVMVKKTCNSGVMYPLKHW